MLVSFLVSSYIYFENGGTEMNVAKYIDHTLLKPDSTREQIDKILEEAKSINSNQCALIQLMLVMQSQQLLDTDVLVCTVIGFPLGATTTDVKVFETENAIKNGASEIDMVINIGALKDQRYDEVQKILRVLSQLLMEKQLK